MKAYSYDLRERIIRAVASGLSKAEVARRFTVDVSTVKRYVRRQAGGALAPRRSPGRPRRIGPAQEPTLRAQVAQHDTATLAEHCRTWADNQGVRLSPATMCRALAHAGLPRKKDPSSPPSATRRLGPPGGQTRPLSTRRPSSSSTKPAPTSA